MIVIKQPITSKLTYLHKNKSFFYLIVIIIFRSVIDQFFGGSFNVEWKCVESDTEEVTKTTESFLQLSCFISQDVKYMHSGLKNVILLS